MHVVIYCLRNVYLMHQKTSLIIIETKTVRKGFARIKKTCSKNNRLWKKGNGIIPN